MSAQRPSSGAPSTSNWYPVRTELDTPDKMMATLKQVLDQHYALQQRVNAMAKDGGKATSPTLGAEAGQAGPPPGSGPTDTQILGLRVLPVNPSTLADGAKLTWVAKDGNFQIK